jgi:hypothetical protein
LNVVAGSLEQFSFDDICGYSFSWPEAQIVQGFQRAGEQSGLLQCADGSESTHVSFT